MSIHRLIQRLRERIHEPESERLHTEEEAARMRRERDDIHRRIRAIEAEVRARRPR